MENLIFQLLKKPSLDKQGLAKLKRAWAKKHGQMPKNSQILTVYHQLLKKQKIRRQVWLENLLRLKKVRSLSGIVPIAVLTKPFPCPGQCVYCPTQNAMPKSYLNDEPAVMRAEMANFDPFLQVKRRLEQLEKTGHSTAKIELIVMGGTFSVLPYSYQKSFIQGCFEAANDRKGKTLLEVQRFNQTARNRIVGLTLETRPDQINIEEIKRMRRLGATRVEIGVQSIFDDVLKTVKRGHRVQATIRATRLLKEAGFKVCYHLMPNLPGSSLKRDLEMFQEVFNNPDFKPDMLKIYPCIVLYQAKLLKWFQEGRFKPYSDKDLIELLVKIKKIIPSWIRINRLGRDIPVANIAAGNKLSNIRQVLQKRLKKESIRCRCIRCREIGARTATFSGLKLKTEEYRASGGDEYFLQFVDQKDRLYALLRLRLATTKEHFLAVLQDAAFIRELHVYGRALAIGKKEKQASQHQGLGQRLMARAEEIAHQKGFKKIAVIAGIGARKYYRQLGYHLEETYMVKYL